MWKEEQSLFFVEGRTKFVFCEAVMLTAFVGVIVSFLVGALIAWLTRDKSRLLHHAEQSHSSSSSTTPATTRTVFVEEEQEEEAEANNENHEVDSASHFPHQYGPYASSALSSSSSASSSVPRDFVAAPPTLSETLSSAPPSPRSSSRAVIWEPDDSRNSCNFCLALFSAVRRRHHCRACGLLVCNNCSRDRQRVPAVGLLPVRVCDACKISSIASKKGETVNMQSIRAFALHNNNSKAATTTLPASSGSRPTSRPASPAFILSTQEEATSHGNDNNNITSKDDDDELLQLSRALYNDLSQSFSSKDENVLSDAVQSPEKPVRRALFTDDALPSSNAPSEWVSVIPENFGVSERLKRAEALANAPNWQVVQERDGITVLRLSTTPVDAFCVRTILLGNAKSIAEKLLSLELRLKWDEDLDPSGCAELMKWGNVGSLQRHLSKQVRMMPKVFSFVICC